MKVRYEKQWTVGTGEETWAAYGRVEDDDGLSCATGEGKTQAEALADLTQNMEELRAGNTG